MKSCDACGELWALQRQRIGKTLCTSCFREEAIQRLPNPDPAFGALGSENWQAGYPTGEMFLTRELSWRRATNHALVEGV